MRKCIRIVEIIILNIVVLSIPKIGCENYLFRSTSKIKNYQLPFEVKRLGGKLQKSTFQDYCLAQRVKRGKRYNISIL